MRLDHKARVVVLDFLLDQAKAQGKELPRINIAVISHTKILSVAKTIITTTLDHEAVYYVVIHNLFRKEMYLDVFKRTKHTRISDHAFQTAHPEFFEGVVQDE
jgi:hypothetical protein